jgi:hypothetical protein
MLVVLKRLQSLLLKRTDRVGTKRPFRKRSRPMLERLEDRLVLATWTVTGLGDAGNGQLNAKGGGSGDLRYCITNAVAGDTIEFQKGLKGTITTRKKKRDGHVLVPSSRVIRTPAVAA